MQALLLGTQAAAVSAKSAKKGRAMLLNLVLLDGARAAAAAADATDADADAAADAADAAAAADADATTGASSYGGAAEAVPSLSPPPGTAMAGTALAPVAEAAGAAVVATPLADPRRPRTLALDVLPGGAVRAQLLLSDGAQLARLRADAGALHGARVSVRARVATLRRRSAGLVFADLTAGGERLQTAVEGEVLCPDSPGQLALRPGSGVRVTGTLGVSRQGHLALFASRIELLSLPTEPGVLVCVMRQVAAGALDATSAAAALGCSVGALEEARAAFEGCGALVLRHSSTSTQADGMELQAERRFAAALEAALRGGRRENCASRRGAPPPRAEELAALGALERAHGRWDAVPSWELAPPEAMVGEVSEVGEVGEVGEAEGADEPATDSDSIEQQEQQQRWVLGGSAAASAERAARLRYVREKSEPALRWALHQAGLLLERRRQTATAPPRVLLDIGCGRGDLTLALARAHPALRLVGLDSNACALAAARARAEAAGLRNVRFVLLEAARLQLQLAGGGRSGELAALLEEGVDVVVALRACGGLGDAALSLASSRGASALVWPCCFGKHEQLCPADARWGLDEPERQWLCQLADGGDESELAAPAQRVVGCLRLGAAARRRPTARLGLRRAPPGLATQHIALWVEDLGL